LNELLHERWNNEADQGIRDPDIPREIYNPQIRHEHELDESARELKGLRPDLVPSA